MLDPIPMILFPTFVLDTLAIQAGTSTSWGTNEKEDAENIFCNLDWYVRYHCKTAFAFFQTVRSDTFNRIKMMSPTRISKFDDIPRFDPHSFSEVKQL